MFQPGGLGIYVGTPGSGTSPPASANPGFGNSMFKEWLSRRHAPSSSGEGRLEKGSNFAVFGSLPTTKKKIAKDQSLPQKKKRQRKLLSVVFAKKQKERKDKGQQRK